MSNKRNLISGIGLFAVLGLVLFTAAGCNKKSSAKSGYFPVSNEISGWTKTGETRTFDAANLSQYIDGDAERYLKAGVQSASTADYKFQDKIDAVADVYAMSNTEGATKIFESEPPRNAKPIQMGDSARLYGQSLVFRKGRYLVRIVAYDELPEGQHGMVDLGRGIEQRLTQ